MFVPEVDCLIIPIYGFLTKQQASTNAYTHKAD